MVFCAYGAPALVEFPEADFVRLQFAFSGSARTTIAGQQVVVSADQACVTPTDRPCKIEFGAGYKQILIRLDQRAMERKLAALLGAKPSDRLEFTSAFGTNQLHLEELKNLIRFVARELATSPAQAVPNSSSEFLQRRPSDGASAHVRHSCEEAQ